MKSRRVERDAICLFIEELTQLTSLLDVVPHSHGLIDTTSHHKRLPDADIHA